MSTFLTLPDGKSVPVTDGMVIGRDAKVDLALKDAKASRRHARLISDAGVVEIEDLGSSNGTLLNGKRIERRMLRDGDVIAIGTTKISFHESAPISSSAPHELAPGEDLFGDEPEAPPPPRTAPNTAPNTAPSTAPSAAADAASTAPETAHDPAPSAETVMARSVPSPPSSPTPSPPEDSEVLEFADDDVVVVKRQPAPAKPASGLPVGKPRVKAPADSARVEPTRDGGVLQFHKVENKGGVVSQDLGQMSAAKRTILTLIALIVAAALFYGAMLLAA